MRNLQYCKKNICHIKLCIEDDQILLLMTLRDQNMNAHALKLKMRLLLAV